MLSLIIYYEYKNCKNKQHQTSRSKHLSVDKIRVKGQSLTL